MRLPDTADGTASDATRPARRSRPPTPLGAADGVTAALSQPSRGEMHVCLHGELDMLTVSRPRRILVAAVDSVAAETARAADRDGAGGAPPGRVVCDLDGLGFLAVCGVRMLIDVAEHADTRGVELVVRASSRPARRVLDLVGVGGRPVAVIPERRAAPGSATPAAVAAALEAAS